VLKLLLLALDDTDERTGMSGSINGKSYSDPRICDMAAHTLHDLDEKRYAFDLSASFKERELARLKLKNILRKERGLPEVPLPQPRIARPPADEVFRPLAERYELADTAELNAAERAVLDLGVDALPAVLKRRDAAAETDPRRAKLDRLARRLALLVVDVKISEKSSPLDKGLSDRLEALKNKPFEPDMFHDLAETLAGKMNKEYRGFRLAAVRGEGDAGVTLAIDLLNRKRAEAAPVSGSSSPGERTPTDRPYAWNHDELVRVGRKVLENSSGTGGKPPGRRDDADFADLIVEVVDAPPEQDFEIRVSAIGQYREEGK
jgi:hypothetical protein